MSPDDRQPLLHLLYPWYKEEVFRRRAQMTWLTACAVSGLFLLLAWVTLSPPSLETSGRRGFLIASVLLFSGLFAYLILQQRDRHRQAKQVLIVLEEELKLFDGAPSASGTPLYPAEWRSAWRQDHSVAVYLTTIGGMTALVVAALIAGEQ